MQERLRLRDALAGAIAAAEEARAPERVLELLRGAYRTLESSRFVDEDMIRWAEAGLGAWRRWSATRLPSDQRLLIIAPGHELAESVRAMAERSQLAAVTIVHTRTAALEALATLSPTVLIFDHDSVELAPSIEMLEWLATDFASVRRIGYCAQPAADAWQRERGLYHALLPKPPTLDALLKALMPSDSCRAAHG